MEDIRHMPCFEIYSPSLGRLDPDVESLIGIRFSCAHAGRIRNDCHIHPVLEQQENFFCLVVDECNQDVSPTSVLSIIGLDSRNATSVRQTSLEIPACLSDSANRHPA